MFKVLSSQWWHFGLELHFQVGFIKQRAASQFDEHLVGKKFYNAISVITLICTKPSIILP
jgi:hypothetical protein